MSLMHERSLDKALWSGQWILALAFDLGGMIKLGLRAHDVHAHFGLDPGTTSSMLHAVGLAEVAISLLVILPALLRLRPQLSTAAAAGLGAVALVGTASPATALGTGVAAANLALAAMAAFVVWGRLKAPVTLLLDKESGAVPRVHDEAVLTSTFTAPVVTLPTARLSVGQVPSHP